MTKNELLESETENQESTDQEHTLYTQKRALEITGLSVDEIRNWETYFNLQIPRTKGGQRRYTIGNLEQFKTIKTKIDETGWGINDAIQWWNGDDTEKILRDVKIRTDLEKEVMALREVVESQSEELKAYRQVMETQNEYLKKLPDIISQEISKSQNQIASTSIQRIAAPEEPETTAKEVKKLNFVQKFGAKLLGLEK